MQVARTGRFKKAWGQLTKGEQALAQKAITNLVGNIRYPALRVKKIKGTENIWEARVSRSLRITFQMGGNAIILRNIGHHNETLGRP